ncbi:MAG: hypothetical protein MUQ10_07720 [Anaerolineae bacterium]|nr:hypothetical protein [Anaerolineae bacterium]
MKVRHIAQVAVTLLLLLLATESGSALTAQPNGSSEGVNTTATSVANAPWFNAEVDTAGDTGQFASVAIDQLLGDVYISYYDATNKNLRVARYVGTGGNCGEANDWHCQTTDSGPNVGRYCSLAVERGVIDVAYQDSAVGELRYARGLNTAPILWGPPQIVDRRISPSTTGLYTSMKVQTSAPAFISYYTSNPGGVDELKLAHRVSSGGNCGHGTALGHWQCDTIHTGGGVGQYTSLALDATGDAHIAYYDAGNGDLRYATNSSGNNCGPGNTWTCYAVSTLNDVGRYASMYVDSASNFHIAYYDATNDLLKYAYKVSGGGNCGVLGSAQCDTIDAMPADYHPVGISIAEDAADYPIIAYQSVNGSLNVARPVAALGLPIEYGNCGPMSYLYHTWYCETIDRPNKWAIPPYRHGDFVSIATNSSGLATVAYYEYITASGGNLGVSRQLAQVFMPSVIKSP